MTGSEKAPWYRKPLCMAGLCRTFETNSDEAGVWGECRICHKRVGYIDRASLRVWVEAGAEHNDRQAKLTPINTMRRY